MAEEVLQSLFSLQDPYHVEHEGARGVAEEVLLVCIRCEHAREGVRRWAVPGLGARRPLLRPPAQNGKQLCCLPGTAVKTALRRRILALYRPL